MNKTLKIEYEAFEEENITVLSIIDENDTVLKMFEGKEAEEVYSLLTEMQKG